ncbi:twin-arginine translocation signal domain-containing protein [Paenibacillus sp. SI8]|uniref:twin-arginine translocation signal domain-containing protein n=1 Tax=unclassified Paenibacillus TaxID=185978 RepID=UPI0034672473
MEEKDKGLSRRKFIAGVSAAGIALVAGKKILDPVNVSAQTVTGNTYGVSTTSVAIRLQIKGIRLNLQHKADSFLALIKTSLNNTSGNSMNINIENLQTNLILSPVIYVFLALIGEC